MRQDTGESGSLSQYSFALEGGAPTLLSEDGAVVAKYDKHLAEGYTVASA